ncbi:MAG: hypothetical protein Q9225_005127, partial [Loekoesia sp. 1 TL-2023]
MRSYGTLSSDTLPITETPQPSHSPQERLDARHMRSHKGYSALFICMCLLLVWLFGPTRNQDAPDNTPSSPSAPNPSGEDPEYLWLVEHDRDAHDQRLATLKSLYAVNIFLTNKSEGCASITETSVWNLDRASYADVFLDDVRSSTDKYNKMLRADMIFCERAGYDSTHPSQSIACQIFANSYFSDSGHQLHWSFAKILAISPKLNLAFRPSFDGLHRTKPCICQTGSTSTSIFAANAVKSARRLIVGCLNLDRSPMESITMFSQAHKISPIRKSKRAESMLPVLVPGFYVAAADIPDGYAIEMQNVSRIHSNVLEEDPTNESLLTST